MPIVITDVQPRDFDRNTGVPATITGTGFTGVTTVNYAGQVFKGMGPATGIGWIHDNFLVANDTQITLDVTPNWPGGGVSAAFGGNLTVTLSDGGTNTGSKSYSDLEYREHPAAAVKPKA